MDEVILDELVDRARPLRVPLLRSGEFLLTRRDLGPAEVEGELMRDLTRESSLPEVGLEMNGLMEVGGVVRCARLAFPFGRRGEGGW